MQTRRALATSVFGVVLFQLPVSSRLHAQQDTVRLNELVVTATRTASDRKAVPVSVSTVTGDELRSRGIRFVLDWLREIPGAAVVQNGSFGGVTSLFLRGGESDYTKILIDGVPANQPGGAFNLANLSTDLVERIEIVRGPASVLYGSDAVSGVIQIFTRRGSGPARLDLSARAGTFGTADLRAEGSGGTGKTSWSAGLARFTSDGIYPYNNDYRSNSGSARFGITPDARTDLALVARLGDHRAHFPTDFAGVVSDTNQFNTEQTLSLSLDGGRRLTRSLELRVLAGYFDSEQSFDDQRDRVADTVGFGFESTRDGDVRRTLFDLRALFRPAGSVNLSVGVERVDERERISTVTRSNFGSGIFQDVTQFERDRGNTAGYAQLQAGAGRRLDLHGGVRFDHNQVFGDFTTWRAGMVARPVTGLRLHAAGGTAFRQPTFSEQFAATAFEVGNPDLTPEEATSWEAGAELTLLRDRLTISLTGFTQRFKDLIQFRSADPGEPTYVNIAEARADGFEVGAGVLVTRDWSLGAQYTRLDTEVKDDGGQPGPSFSEGEALLRRPRHSGGATLTWHPAERGRYAVRIQRTGDRADVDFREFPSSRVTLEGYTQVDASVDFPLELILGSGARRFGATASVQNLFDAEYESVVGYLGRRRTLLLGVRASLSR